MRRIAPVLSASLLFAPAAARAAGEIIYLPARIDLGGGIYAYDVVPFPGECDPDPYTAPDIKCGPDEGVIVIHTNNSTSCTVSHSGGTYATASPTDPDLDGVFEARVTLGAVTHTGELWTVTCGVASEKFHVVAQSVPEAWLYSESPPSGYTSAEAFLEDLVTGYDGAGPDFGAYDLGPAMWTTAQDPRRAAWWYLLAESEPGMDIGPDSATTGCGSANCGLPAYNASLSLLSYPTVATSGPLTELVYGDPAGEHLLRISLAALLGRACIKEATCASGTTLELADDYVTAASYWGRSIVGDQNWNHDATDPTYGWPDSISNDDLYWSRNLRASAIAYEWMHLYLSQAERHEWLAGLVGKMNAFYAEDEFNLDPADTGTDGKHYSQHVADGYFNYSGRLLRNGHTWELNAALGITAMVLEESFPDDDPSSAVGPGRALWEEWDGAAATAMSDVFGELGTDGVDVNGVRYGGDGLEALLAYVEANRTLRAQDPNDAWLDNTAMSLSHMTRPDGQRVAFAEGIHYDTNGPSFQMSLVSRYAYTYGGSTGAVAARLGWLGYNAWSTPGSGAHGQRETRDLLFWDPSRGVPSASVAPYRNRCFADTGYVKLASNDDGGVHMVFRGGQMVGGHDDPDVGSLTLYYRGDLVTTDADEQDAKRTAAASTLIVNGMGQHSDGYAFVDAVPESATQYNNSRLSVYLDSSGTAWDGQVFDLVLAASDIRELYRYDSSDSLRGYGGFTNVESSGGTLDELERYVLWLGDRAPEAAPGAGAGAVYLFDRYQTSNATWPFTWRLTTGRQTDPNADGVGDGPYYWPTSIAMSGDYLFEQVGTGLTDDLSFDGTGGCTGCSSASYAEINKGMWNPVPATSGLGAPAFGSYGGIVGGTGNRVATVHATPGDGKMDVVNYDTTTGSNMGWRPTAGRGGATILGYELNRTRTGGDGMLLTGLFPYADGQQRAYVVDQTSGVTGGKRLGTTIKTGSANDGYRVTAYFAEPPSSGVDDTAALGESHLVGEIGVVANAISLPYGWGRYAAQMVGSSFIFYGDEIIRVTSTLGVARSASVAVTWDDGSMWGTVEVEEPAAGPNHVYLDLPSYSMSGIASLSWTGAGTPSYTTVTSSSGNDQVRLTLWGSGQFQLLETTSSVPTGPNSDCFGRE